MPQRPALRYGSFSGMCLAWDVHPSQRRGGVLDAVRSPVSIPTVLVVDDEPAIRMMVRRMLARVPCTVAEAGDGVEALAYVRREPPQLILLDIVMPRLDGWAVLRTLRAEGLTADVPVVLISGNVVLDEEAARELGAAAVLPKPFQLTAVRALVQELLAVPAP